MLLWEALRREAVPVTGTHAHRDSIHKMTRRLPYETQCAALTKSGRRCRGRILPHGDFCPFHDPDVAQKRRRARARNQASRQHRLAHLPGGYLRKLTTRAAVGAAMDRLYREVRLGEVTPEMGRVLFGIVSRILDSGLCAPHGVKPNGRARADRLRPKLSELLTRSERADWRRAVANAPEVNPPERPARRREREGDARRAPAQSKRQRFVLTDSGGMLGTPVSVGS